MVVVVVVLFVKLSAGVRGVFAECSLGRGAAGGGGTDVVVSL